MEQVVTQLKQDVMQQMDVPAGQTEQARNKLRETVKQTVIQKVNGKNSPAVISFLTVTIPIGIFALYFGEEMIVNMCLHYD